jgi:nitroimidazol reductase NimA-like FMN-containing flavoprotein (pyridoxamine 5'-phosphate oxidase superfamily)
MRRKDREVSDLNEIIKIVDKCEVVRLGLVDNGVPYIVPLNFGYEFNDQTLTMYFHSALEGRKIDILKTNPFVCFEMDCSLKITKHEIPCNWSAEHESVIGCGKVIFIEDDAGRKAAMDIIMKRYGFEGVPEYNENIFKKTAIYKLVADSITGKRNIK